MARIARRLAGIGATDLMNAAAFDAYIGPAREITVDPVRKIIALHDGVTAGGQQFFSDAVLPDELAAVATSGQYADLLGLPALGSAAGADTEDFATAAQGAKADAVAGGHISTISVFLLEHVPVIVQYIDIAGYYEPGDGGGHRKVRIATPSPAKAWHKQSADGAWWEVAEEIVNPKMLGAKADGIRDDYAECQAALEFSRSVRFTAETYLLSAGLGIPSNTTVDLGGATLKMADDADVYENVLTNWNHWKKQNITRGGGSPGSTYDVYDENIHIIGTGVLECRGDQRIVGLVYADYATYGGCGIKFCGTKFSSADGQITINNPIMHGADMSPFDLATNWSVGHNGYDLVDGGCLYTLFKGLHVKNSIVDDGITTHFAKHFTVELCTAVFDDARKAILYENQNGIEIDGGSQHGVVRGNYIYGYAKGVAVVGHYHEPPARHILVEGNTAEYVYQGYSLWNNPGGGDVGSPNYIAPADRVRNSQARDVTFRDNTVRNMTQINARDPGDNYLLPFWNYGYSDVVVDGLTVDGINADSVATCYLQILVNGYNTKLKNINGKNIDHTGSLGTTMFISIPNGLSQSGIEVDGVFIEEVTAHAYILSDNVTGGALTSAKNFEIGYAGAQLVSPTVSRNPKCIIENINIKAGTVAPCKVYDDGGVLRTFLGGGAVRGDGINVRHANGRGDVYAGAYTPTITGVTNVSASTASECSYFRLGNIVYVFGRASVTPTATGTTEIGISLPIASAMTANEVSGIIAGLRSGATEAGGIYTDAANDRATARFSATATTASNYQFQFSYLIK